MPIAIVTPAAAIVVVDPDPSRAALAVLDGCTLGVAGSTLRLGPPTVLWVNEMLAAMDRVGRFDHLDQVKVPTLLIGGGRVETLTTEAVALSSGGNRRLIGAYAMLQLLLPAESLNFRG